MRATQRTPSRMEILILSCLARQPMHGYEIKVELRYRHVKWWAKCDHGHLYATLPRLEKHGLIERLEKGPDAAPTGKRERRIYEITAEGRAHLRTGLLNAASATDPTYFEFDLFLSACLRLERDEALEALERRRETLGEQLALASEGLGKLVGVPVNGVLIIEHRVHHLSSELVFLENVVAKIQAYEPWASALGSEPIETYVKRTGALLEE